MANVIGKFEFIKDYPFLDAEPISIKQYDLTELPEYKNGEEGEKILLFTLVNSKGEDCFIGLATTDNPENDEAFEKIMKRIEGLKSSSDKCLLDISVNIAEPYSPGKLAVSVGLTSDLTKQYKYVFARSHTGAEIRINLDKE